MNRKLSVFCLVFLQVLAVSVYAQEDVNPCAQNLKKAQTSYDEGRINDVPGLLKKCLDDNSFDKTDKQIALKLLTLTYIYLDQPENADKTYLTLLKVEPEFKVNPNVDPGELLNLHSSFRTRPVFSVAIKGGGNFPNFHFENKYTVSPDGSLPGYKGAFGFQLGVGVELRLAKNIDLLPEVIYSSRKITISHSSEEYGDLTGTESNSFLELPVLARFSIQRATLSPFVTLGGSANMLISSSGVYEFTSGLPETGSTINLDHKRTGFNYSVVGGAGFKYKVGRPYFILDARYYKGFLNVVNSDMRYSMETDADKELLVKYKLVDSDYKLDNITVSIGVVIPVFVPKKLVK
jgi:hypothetical protein